jgi:hypothetical protein
MFGEEMSIERSQRAWLRQLRFELATSTPSRVCTLEMLMRLWDVAHSMRESGMTRSAWK